MQIGYSQKDDNFVPDISDNHDLVEHDSAVTVSIIMPCRNASATIAQAIESVLTQGFTGFELIIVDDGSTDSTVELVKAKVALDARAKLIMNPSPGRGVCYARNIALSAAVGRFVAFLDSDDYWLQGSLLRRVELLKNGHCSVVFGSYIRLLPDERLVRVPVKKSVAYRDMLLLNHIGNLTGMYDRDNIGLVLQENIRHEDYLMWCKILRRAGMAYSVGEEPLGVYRVSPSSLSGNKLNAFIWHWQALRCGLGLGLCKAAICQFVYAFHSVLSRVAEKVHLRKV